MLQGRCARALALIGRLARDQRAPGQGVGDMLLADAIRRILSAAGTLAVFAIVVEAKDEKAAGFTRDFGFESFPSRPSRVFMPASHALAAIEKASE